jgi:hypothetical protein
VQKTEYDVPDLRPASFIMEILDSEEKPVADVKFNVAVDGGVAEVEETDADGVFKISRPVSKVDLALAGETVSQEEDSESPQDESRREPGNEDDVLTPVKVV